jgi:hypothetical protein
MKRPKTTQDQIKFILENYPDNGAIFCSEKTGIPIRRVKKICYKAGVKLTKESRIKIQRKLLNLAHKQREINKNNFDLYDVNPGLFINPTTPEVAYILGLLWADGYIREVGSIAIEAVKSDIDIFYPIFLKTGSWLINYRNRSNRKPQGRIHKNNIIIGKFLIENDYTSKSTASACKILSKIPEHLKHYWFRGLFDGDGCFYINQKQNLIQLSIASSFEQDWGFCEKIMEKLNIKYTIKRSQQLQKGKINKFSVIRVTNRKGIKIFGDYIYNNYENDKIGLPRKYNKFKEIKQMIGTSDGLSSPTSDRLNAS